MRSQYNPRYRFLLVLELEVQELALELVQVLVEVGEDLDLDTHLGKVEWCANYLFLVVLVCSQDHRFCSVTRKPYHSS